MLHLRLSELRSAAWLACVLGFYALPATAQDAADADDGRERLPDVVVTSQKIEQTLEEVPVSVSTLDGSSIRDSGLNSFIDAQNYVPNVAISLNSTAGTFAIRGYATATTNPGFDPSVGAVIDGVYYGRSQFLNAFFFDIDRLEVLRGPQGTLFGKNSTAGVMNLVTHGPENVLAGGMELQLNGYGARVVTPTLQIPLGDQVSLRLTGNWSEGDQGVNYNTYLKRPENNPESLSGRLRLRYTPDENAKVDLEFFQSHETMGNNAFQFAYLTDRMLQTTRVYDPAIEAVVDRTTSANYKAESVGTLRGANASFTYDLSNRFGIPELAVTTIVGGAESITDAKNLDADFSPIPFIHDQLAEPSLYRQVTDEVRLVGRGDNFLGFGHEFNFVTGAFLSSSRFTYSDIFKVDNLGAAAAYCNASATFCGLFPQASPIPGGVGGALGETLGYVLDRVTALTGGLLDQQALVNIDQRGQSYSLFGQFEAFLLEDWALIGGLRYGNETKTALASSASNSLLIKGITAQEDHNTSLSLTEVDYSPRAGIKWQPNKKLSAFFTYGRGYKSGGFNSRPLGPENLTYEPESATSFELGTKALIDWAGGPMRISATLYQTNFDNLQVSTFIGGNFVVLNAATAVSRGFDFDIHWLTPAHGFSVTASAGLADARYKSYPDAPAIAEPGNPDTQDISGRRLSFAPKWTASLIPAYHLPTDGVSATIAVDVLYRGDRYLDVDLDPKKLQPATTIFNTRLTLESASRAWGLSFVAHNLTQEVTSDQAISQPLAPGNVLFYRTDYGRYVSGNVTYQF